LKWFDNTGGFPYKCTHWREYERGASCREDLERQRTEPPFLRPAEQTTSTELPEHDIYEEGGKIRYAVAEMIEALMTLQGNLAKAKGGA